MGDFFAALGLLLVLEGLSYAAFPASMREALTKLITYPDGFLRRCGFIAALAGLVMIYYARLA